MLNTLLNTLRHQGIDVKSPRRRDATCPMAVQRRLLAGRDVRVVFDCGAHHGRIARAYHEMFPAAKVFCFEPTPQTFQVLSRNLADIGAVEAINAAVGDQSGTLNFYMGQDEQGNSLAKPGGEARVTQVRVISLGDFCAERGIHNIDVLKMDVEGYELRTLMGLETMLRSQAIDVIYCEVRFEPPAPGCTYFVELAAYLRTLGYRFFGFYDTIYDESLRFDWGDAIFVSDAELERYRQRIGGRTT